MTYRIIPISILIYFSILIFNTQISLAEETNIQPYIEKAVILENSENYELAREVLEFGYQDTSDITILDKWVEFDSAIFDNIRQENKNNSIAVWHRPVISVPAMTTGFPFQHMELKRREIFEFETTKPVMTLDTNIITRVLEKYEILKKSQKHLATRIKQKILSCDNDELRDILRIHMKQKKLIREVVFSRCNYLSYDAISPYLARTMQLLYLSENANMLSVGHSSELLEEAAKCMASAANQNNILDAHQDVRDQFIEVLKSFKDTAGTAELEELKVVQTVQDSFQAEKVKGKERWWQ